jgi:hypothetical protein
MCQGIILEQNQFVQKEKPFKTPSPWFESLSRLLPPEDPWSILWRHIFFLKKKVERNRTQPAP